MEIKTSNSGWWSFMVSGLVAIIYGLLALLLPKDIIKTVMIVSGIALIVIGLVCLIFSLRRKKMELPCIIGALMLGSILGMPRLGNRGFYIVSAILSILFGVLLMVNPFESVEVFVALTGVLALAFGIIMMMFGFTLRKVDKELVM